MSQDLHRLERSWWDIVDMSTFSRPPRQHSVTHLGNPPLNWSHFEPLKWFVWKPW